MYKALADVDSFVRLPSGRVAVVLKHLEGEGVECQYVDCDEKVTINATHLRAADDPIES